MPHHIHTNSTAYPFKLQLNVFLMTLVDLQFPLDCVEALRYVILYSITSLDYIVKDMSLGA